MFLPSPIAVPPAPPTVAPTLPPSTWPVIVTDSVRDVWDWVAVGGGVFFGVASLVLGSVAVLLARRANRTAERARAAIVSERQRTLALEVLRDLLATADAEHFAASVAGAPGTLRTVAGKLSLLPNEDLPFWRAATNSSQQDLVGLLRGYATDPNTVIFADLFDGDGPTSLAIDSVRAALLSDVQDAISRRMRERDA